MQWNRGPCEIVISWGDGHACKRIADAIEWKFGLRQDKPEEFNT